MALVKERDVHAEHVNDISKFQTRILTILSEDSRYGLAIKRELEEYYGEKVNHGRLYPNLDKLVNKGLVEKSELDKRTNEYALTDDGRSALRRDILWLTERVDHDGPRVKEGDA